MTAVIMTARRMVDKTATAIAAYIHDVYAAQEDSAHSAQESEKKTNSCNLTPVSY